MVGGNNLKSSPSSRGCPNPRDALCSVPIKSSLASETPGRGVASLSSGVRLLVESFSLSQLPLCSLFGLSLSLSLSDRGGEILLAEFLGRESLVGVDVDVLFSLFEGGLPVNLLLLIPLALLGEQQLPADNLFLLSRALLGEKLFLDGDLLFSLSEAGLLVALLFPVLGLLEEQLLSDDPLRPLLWYWV